MAAAPGVPIEVIRNGRVERFIEAGPTLSSAAAGWTGLAFEDYSTPACLIARHEHLQNFLQLVLGGSVKYEVVTGGRTRRFEATSGTTFVLPPGTVDEIRWLGETHRIAVAIHQDLLRSALGEGVQAHDIELSEHWNLVDRHISAVLVAMRGDLADASPAGRLYGESLANALAVYLVRRYSVRPYPVAAYRGGLPRYRLTRVKDFIEENLANDVALEQLARIAGMSPHYFAELFKRSTGFAPHQFVLRRRMERAKQLLRDPRRTVSDAGFGAGFQDPSHFARMFRRLVGASPSKFRSEIR